MYLFVIDTYLCPRIERSILPYMGVRVSNLGGYGSLKTFRCEIEFWSFCSQTGHGFCTLVLNLVCSVFLKEATFSSLSI